MLYLVRWLRTSRGRKGVGRMLISAAAGCFGCGGAMNFPVRKFSIQQGYYNKFTFIILS
jgi:hypothetical protein